MGAVYEIEHELTKHRRALKMLHASMTSVPSVVERFLREASAAGRVGNPHIVESFDAGTLDSGEPYLVLEMLRGETLAQIISAGPMPLAQLVNLIGQACDGIQAAHTAGIVHRDLKPENLFVIDMDEQPFVKILDFGISKFDPSQTGGLQLTQAGAALGTPYYMSPEQIRGEVSLDARADIYALGVILYECAASIRPFEAETLTHLAILIHGGNPTPLSQIRPDLPPGFVQVVQRAMATDREQRYQTVAELAAALEQFGTISFRSRGPRSMAFTPPSAVVARTAGGTAAGTSAAGVSMRAASATAVKASPRGSTIALIAAAFALLVIGVGAFFVVHRPAAPTPGEAESIALAAHPPGLTSVTPAPVASPNAVASASAAPAPALPPPIVTPKLMDSPPVEAASAKPTASAHAPATAHPVDTRAHRTDERGLAKDNPFR